MVWKQKIALFAMVVAAFSTLMVSGVAFAGEGGLEVEVVEEDGTPVPAAGVVVGDRGEDWTDAEGYLRVEGLPAGPVTVRVQVDGYEPFEARPEVLAGEVVLVEVVLARLNGNGEETEDPEDLVVTTRAMRLGPAVRERPSTTLSGTELQREMSSSVPATLESVPGFSAQYNGPGASSPTIRGMPGDRVLMLEDGHRTGDIYWTASDHGVMVEPVSARRLEVFRGPSGLIFGSNALGGVVNVVREDIPVEQPESVEGTFMSQLESVNSGASLGAALRGPAGPTAWYAEATGRWSGNTRTPLGEIEDTEMVARNLAVGGSWVPERGVLGIAVRHYDNIYGVPGQFNGELIPGGHPGGVHIEALRQSGRLQGDVYDLAGPFESISMRASGVRFVHDEIEAVVGGEEILGARFRQESVDVHLLAEHMPLDGERITGQGALGVALQGRNLEAGGASPGTRSGQERSVGVFGFEEIQLRPVRLQAGLRFDAHSVTSDDLSTLRVRTRERLIEREVRPRTFQGLSGSIAGLVDFTEDWTAGVSVARAFRAPRIEELYSDGPHLADFSFDIGNPDLSAEVGTGVDLFLRSDHERLKVEFAVYGNLVDGYIHYVPTGETVRVFREGARPRTTPVFEAMGEDAIFLGTEGRVQWEVVDRLILDVTGSFTMASYRADGDPLPFIPPLSGRLAVRYEGSTFFGSLGGDLSAAQNRVPRPITVEDALEQPQQPTDGYGLLNAMAGWRHSGDRFDQTVILQVRNITDRVYRDHLSRIKDVAPQPGRNVQLSYQAHF